MVQPNEAESLFMELRIIFMIISTFSGSAARQNPASVQAQGGPGPRRLGAGRRGPELLPQAAGDRRPNLGPALLKTLRRK